MTAVQITLRGGETRTIEAADGDSLMQTIRDAGIDELLAICGGCCSCATCHVWIPSRQAATLSPMGRDEDDLLDTSSYRTADPRLSCQIRLGSATAALQVTIAPED